MNQEQNNHKWNEFTDRINGKYEKKLDSLRQTARNENAMNITIDFEKNMKRRRQQKREHDRFKDEIIERHLEKLRKKELIQKKREELIEFSLLKQKELHRDPYS